jgi:hypothetical protein
MTLTELAHVAVVEGYTLPLDFMVNMANQGVIIDDFVSKIEGGISIDDYLDQIEMYGA